MATKKELIQKNEVELKNSGATESEINYDTDKGEFTIISFKNNKTGKIESKTKLDTIPKQESEKTTEDEINIK